MYDRTYKAKDIYNILYLELSGNHLFGFSLIIWIISAILFTPVFRDHLLYTDMRDECIIFNFTTTPKMHYVRLYDETLYNYTVYYLIENIHCKNYHHMDSSGVLPITVQYSTKPENIIPPSFLNQEYGIYLVSKGGYRVIKTDNTSIIINNIWFTFLAFLIVFGLTSMIIFIPVYFYKQIIFNILAWGNLIYNTLFKKEVYL
jgi:hypothetical protein